MDNLFECDNFSIRQVNLKIRSVWQHFEIVTRPNVALCIPRIETGEILLVRQLRASVNEEVVEFPAGRVEIGETIEDAARRELQEEIGFRVRTLKLVGSFLTAVHFSDEKITVFVADGEIVGRASPTPKEDLRQFIKSSPTKIRDLIATGSIIDAKTIAAYALIETKGVFTQPLTRPYMPSQIQHKSSKVIWLLSNGPAIVTVLGSATLAILAFFVELSQLRLIQAILGLLALIGTSLLTERIIEGRSLHRSLSAIEGRVSQVLTYAQDVEAAGLDKLIVRRRDLPPLEERLEGSRQVAISGGSLFRLVNEYQSLFEHLAETGCRLRFLITDPDSHAAEVLSSVVAYESSDVESYRAQMRAALHGLRKFTSRFPEVCEVKISAVAPPFSIVVVEKNNSSRIQLELYPFRLPARDRPILILDKEHDPKLYSLFSSQFEALWGSGFVRTSTSIRHNTEVS